MRDEIVWDAYLRRISRAIAKGEPKVRSVDSPYVSLVNKLRILAKYGVSVFTDEEHVNTIFPPEGDGHPIHYATVIITITYNPLAVMSDHIPQEAVALLPAEAFSLNVTSTASTTPHSWTLSSEYGIEAACTRAINRAINMTFHEVFALGEGYGMGDAEQVFQTIERLLEELEEVNTKKDLAEIVKKINAHNSSMSRSQKKLARLILEKKKNAVK